MDLQSTMRWSLRVLLVLLFTAGAGTVFHAVHASSESDAAEAARHAYEAKIEAHYNNRFGETTHFLPSLATTDTGEFIDPKSFPTAKYCGHCHQEAHAQWRQSAHSNSNRPIWYLRNVNLLTAEKGVEYTRHCEGCHDPVALFAGVLTEGAPVKRPYDQDGITCMVCHSIQKVDTRGTGSYVMGVPAVLVDDEGKPITHPVSDAEILAHLDRHSKAVMKDFYRTSEFCASCHKAALPRSLNDYKWQRAISLYDEWQASSFAKQSPLPFYVKDSVSTCQTCHMQREALGLPDPGAKKGQLASHRWLGANTIIPKYYGFDEQARRIVQFLQNGVFNVDLFALEHGDSNDSSKLQTVSAPLGLVAYSVAPGERLTADVVIQNKGIAHSHVPEQRDMYESWVDFTVKDAAGKVLSESGFLKPNGDLDERAHSFTNRLINKKGTLNDLHQVWDSRVVAYNNTIQSGRSQVVRYTFTMPQGATDSVTLTATVKYRRFDQHFMDFGMNKHYEEPVVDMVSASRTVRVGNNPTTTPDPSENKEWMRWNNYGIALLDAQQYAASLDAFNHVAKLRPDYADAYTNMAIVEIQWERYADARPHLAEALKLSPNNSRALYYRALVERNEGKLDLAVADFQSVLKSYPRSRDALRELGFSFYQQHKYPEAMAEYQALQGVDPDDLAAHYNLAILYRRLGDKAKAVYEAGRFADEKDDPTANTYALEFLRNHTELANESVPWHAHELDTVNADTPAGSGHVAGAGNR
ncbi:MAG TPA: tetratricopeptide repeat protein [Acidobacteriaceae bacterium]|nr:tetratricopeptide repeat protein [Acidobacteriaceae bacterium]